MLSVFVVPVAAVPKYTNVSSITMDLTFSGATANCDSVIKGFSETDTINATFTLQRREANGSYTLVKTWPDQSVSGTTLRFSKTYPITASCIYRFNVTTDVIRHGVTETVDEWVESES
jgi:hypothetical protein